MLFRQLFDSVSSTYTYLLASRAGGEALLIDPVFERVDRYLQLLNELDLRLVKAVDTHTHADHITGLGTLRDITRCVTVLGENSKADVVSMRVREGDRIAIEGVSLDVLETPGHTDDSYSFLLRDRVFTGDALLIRGTGRTDFQNGDPYAAYDTLFNKLLKLPEDTRVYPAHDYKGDTVSTIGEEKAHNPRLQVRSAEEYVDIMNALHLPNPKLMDVAVPANLKIGYKADDPTIREGTLSVVEARRRLERSDGVFIDLREGTERQRDGVIPHSVHVPYVDLAEAVLPGGALSQIAGRPLILYCAYGERSALALRTLREAGLTQVFHLGGGLAAWRREGGAIARTDSAA